VKGTRTAAAAVVLAGLASGAMPTCATAELPPGVESLVSANAKARAVTLASPRLYTQSSHALLLAFVLAGGAAAGERVGRLFGDGLHWSPVARSDGRTGATEVWRARAGHRLSGRIVAKLASAAYPASITVVAYGGTSPYVAAHAASKGRASKPRITLRPTAGSLVWTVGLSERQRTAVPISASPSRRVVLRTFDRRHRTGAWIELAAVRSSHVASAAGASWARSWNLAAVDVVVPSLKRLIEEGLLSAYSANHAGPADAAALPRYCPPTPAFEVGVQDDPVFLGLQPAMTPTRGYELAATVFHARLLRLNVDWGEVKRYGWAPYDRAVQMARERCWTVYMTIMWTPIYEEKYWNSELSGKHLNPALLASFATETAARYAGQVGRFAIGNEPNGGKFMALTGNVSADLATYDHMYLAGYNAVKAADPRAEVIAGEIGERHIYEWLANLASLPSSGVSVHAYSLGKVIGELVKYIAPVPLLVSEDGVPASEPNQIAHDIEREEAARHAGAKMFVFYQLSRADSNERFWWNTGIE
jgi:hypothetical protein